MDLDDVGGQDIVSYHWHPLGADGYEAPHFHAMGSKPHYPSGRVALEWVVRTSITEFRAEPEREDWENVLTINESVFLLYRTWHDKVELAKEVPERRSRNKAKAK